MTATFFPRLILGLSAALMLSAAANAATVRITPLGSHAGEFCRYDRALILEDPDGTRLLYDPGRTVFPKPDRTDGSILSPQKYQNTPHVLRQGRFHFKRFFANGMHDANATGVQRLVNDQRRGIACPGQIGLAHRLTAVQRVADDGVTE